MVHLLRSLEFQVTSFLGEASQGHWLPGALPTLLLVGGNLLGLSTLSRLDFRAGGVHLNRQKSGHIIVQYI
jgi:hypothetical protein